MGIPQRSDASGERHDVPPFAGGLGVSAPEGLLTPEDLASIRVLLAEAERLDRRNALWRMPAVTLGAGFAIWTLAIYGLWSLVT